MKMKVLMVDDEPNIREGLKQIIDWESLNFSICGEAANGRDALYKIMKYQPELTLLDIRIPIMSGLELTSRARQQGYEGKIIILSGYSEFTYARDAIKLGVESYLLKPIDEEELYEAVKKVKTQLEREFSRSTVVKGSSRHAELEAIGALLLNRLHDEDAAYLPDDLRLGSTIQAFQVAVIGSGRLTACAEAAVCSRLNDCFQGRYITLALENRLVILFKGLEPAELLEKLKRNFMDMNPAIDLIGLGRSVGRPEEICRSYDDALRILDRKFFYQENEKVVSYSSAWEAGACPTRFKTLNFDSYAEKLCRYLVSGELKKIEETFDLLKTDFLNRKIQPGMVKGLLSSLYIQAQQKAQGAYPEIELKMLSDAEIINQIYSKSCLSDAVSYLKSAFVWIAESIENADEHGIISKVLRYIDKNSSDDLKLESLADLFNYNSAYLGKLFTKSTGCHFNLYLDKTRIGNAKNLLKRADLKVYQISEMVGYKNLDYFYKKFKKYVGESPREYRRRVGIFSE